jgi:hypothetical protein
LAKTLAKLNIGFSVMIKFIVTQRSLATAALLLLAAVARAESIVSARYAQPVLRYQHFAAGKPHEYAQLHVTTSTGRSLSWQLPAEQVFEDTQPRLVRLRSDGALQVLSIVSSAGVGARLVVFQLREQQLQVLAQSPAIGRHFRWLNPVGVADLDGDGQAEVVAVITPHIGGILKAYRIQGAELVELAASTDFSNHLYGSSELDLSMLIALDGQTYAVVPDFSRQNLRLMQLKAQQWREAGRCSLADPLTGNIKQSQAGWLEFATSRGVQKLQLKDCMRP